MSNDRTKTEGLHPTLSINRFKNDSLDPTLSVDRFKKQVRYWHCRLIDQICDDRCQVLVDSLVQQFSRLENKAFIFRQKYYSAEYVSAEYDYRRNSVCFTIQPSKSLSCCCANIFASFHFWKRNGHISRNITWFNKTFVQYIGSEIPYINVFDRSCSLTSWQLDPSKNSSGLFWFKMQFGQLFYVIYSALLYLPPIQVR
jgi:hypothetical protein